MTDTLSDAEVKRLAELGKKIMLSLSCDINAEGMPCRTDRLTAVFLMKEYVRISEGQHRIRMLKHVCAYRGLDGETYGDFKQGETYKLPKEETEWLLKAGLAEVVK